MVIRRASPADYQAFCSLFPELHVDDATPSRETWSAAIAPSTWVATKNEEVLGYCYIEEYPDTGYVRNIVTAASARRNGVATALMHEARNHLRARGKGSWRLNVKADNVAARTLYEKLGMRTRYASKALRLPWKMAKSLPEGRAAVGDLGADRDELIEDVFDLPRGQLASARALGRVLLEAKAFHDSETIGLSVFDPKFPGAFPFRVKTVDALTPLLEAMRSVVPHDEYVNLVAEDDEDLARLLTGAGASVRDHILHMVGAL